MCLGDSFNNRKGIVELQSTKKEGYTHVILKSHGTCVKVLKELLSITCRYMELYLIWFFTVESYVIIYYISSCVIPQIPFFIDTKVGFLCSKEVAIAAFEKKRNISDAIT